MVLWMGILSWENLWKHRICDDGTLMATILVSVNVVDFFIQFIFKSCFEFPNNCLIVPFSYPSILSASSRFSKYSSPFRQTIEMYLWRKTCFLIRPKAKAKTKIDINSPPKNVNPVGNDEISMNSLSSSKWCLCHENMLSTWTKRAPILFLPDFIAVQFLCNYFDVAFSESNIQQLKQCNFVSSQLHNNVGISCGCHQT